LYVVALVFAVVLWRYYKKNGSSGNRVGDFEGS